MDNKEAYNIIIHKILLFIGGIDASDNVTLFQIPILRLPRSSSSVAPGRSNMNRGWKILITNYFVDLMRRINEIEPDVEYHPHR